MKISSEHINNLLAYARERHGAPCRVLFREWFDNQVDVCFQILDWKTAERTVIDEE